MSDWGRRDGAEFSPGPPTRQMLSLRVRPGSLKMHEAGCLCVCLRGAWGTLRTLGPRVPWWLGGQSMPVSRRPTPRSCPALSHSEAPSPIKRSLPQMTLPTCVLKPLSLPQSLLSWLGGGRPVFGGEWVTGPPPSPGGDQPAPASLESGPSAPGTQKAEEEGLRQLQVGGVAGVAEVAFPF